MRRLAAAIGLVGTLAAARPARAEPTEPVMLGWWSLLDDAKYDTTTSSAHAVTAFNDTDVFYYEPSGAHGMLEDPAVLPPTLAWNVLVSRTLAKASSPSLAPEFAFDATSDLNEFTRARFGWALALLYLPQSALCEEYGLHLGSVDDSVEVLANEKIVGYHQQPSGEATLRLEQLRPGINEVILIHAEQQAAARSVKDVYFTRAGAKIPLANKSLVWGRVSDAATRAPIPFAKVSLERSGMFETGPSGFYLFDKLADGDFTLRATRSNYKRATATASVKLGTPATEAVRIDLALTEGCECPDGTKCWPNGDCLASCKSIGEFAKSCEDPSQTCVATLDVCIKDPCDTIDCQPGFACRKGSCVELSCDAVCCGAGQTCSAGKCVPNLCPPSGCLAGAACVGGTCVDPCNTMTCVSPLACKEGKCVDPCVAAPASCGGDAGVDGGIAPPPDSGVASDDDPPPFGGCACGVAGAGSAPPFAAAMLLIAGLIARRRTGGLR